MSDDLFKVLNCSLVSLLAVPAPALTVWMAYFLLRNEADESYPSLDTLEAMCGINEKSIRINRTWLERNGWLVRVPGSAADRYSRKTRGSFSVPIYRVTEGPEQVDPNVTLPSFASTNVTLPCFVVANDTLPCFATTKSGTPNAPSNTELDLDGELDAVRVFVFDPVVEKEVVQDTGPRCAGANVCSSSLTGWGNKNKKPICVEQELRSTKSVSADFTVQHSYIPLSASGPTAPTPEHAAPPSPVRMTDWGYAVCTVCDHVTQKEYGAMARHLRIKHPEATEQEVRVPCPHGCGFHSSHYLFAPASAKAADTAMGYHLRKCPASAPIPQPASNGLTTIH